MRDVFPHIENHNSDIYIADYTEYSKTHDTSVSGVKILEIFLTILKIYT